jgi:hypothetical protein
MNEPRLPKDWQENRDEYRTTFKNHFRTLIRSVGPEILLRTLADAIRLEHSDWPTGDRIRVGLIELADQLDPNKRPKEVLSKKGAIEELYVIANFLKDLHFGMFMHRCLWAAREIERLDIIDES